MTYPDLDDSWPPLSDEDFARLSRTRPTAAERANGRRAEACVEKPRPEQSLPAGRDKPATSENGHRRLEFMTIGELRRRVAAAGPRRWLLRGLWPAESYGVFAGDAKAQKSWATMDVAVSVASGTPWLDHVPVDSPGPVLIFVGEGDEHEILRRTDAVAGSRGLVADDLPIVICPKVPHLSSEMQLTEMRQQIEAMSPALVVLDPLYLAAKGAKGSDLYAMGDMLGRVQEICQEYHAGLWVTHHQNRKEGTGLGRMSGAGPAEWARVAISAEVKSRSKNSQTEETIVVTRLEVIGGQVAGGTMRVTRRIRAENPDDLDSPLVYSVTTEADDTDDDGPSCHLKPSTQKILDVLRESTHGLTQREIGDAIAAAHGHGLRRETISAGLNDLVRSHQADSLDTKRGREQVWIACD